MRLLARPALVVISSLVPLVFLTLGLFFYLWYREGTIDPCRMVEKRLIAALVESYSGTSTEPNLLEPVALVLVRKRVSQFVREKSEVECGLILYRLCRNSREIEKRVRELGK